MDEQRLREIWSRTIQDWTGDPGATLKPTLSGDETIAPSQPDVAQEVGGLELLGEIGRGGMGVVFRARQPALDRDIAVKRIRADRPDAQGRFLAEARVAGRLEHPNIVPVYDLGRTGDEELFLAMKLVGGQPWSGLLRESRGDLERHLSILQNVGNAVAFAHSRGVVHRDLKPDNVMVGEFGEVLLMDWGVATQVGAAAGTAGSPSYMAPEQAEGRDVGPYTDVYQLGAILHEILTGKPPHLGAGLLEVLAAASHSAPPRYGSDVPVELQALCHKAMAREPGERFESVKAFQDALEDFRTHRESTTVARNAAAMLEECESGAVEDRNRLYARFAESVAAFRQALLLWEGNAAARAGELRARTAFAESALLAGDLGLAESQDVPELRDRIRAEQERVARAVRSARRMRVGLAATTILIIVGLSAGIYLVDREKTRAVGAEADAKEQRNRAVDAEAEARQEAWAARLGNARALYDRGIALLSENEHNRAAAYLMRAMEVAPRGGAPEGFVGTWRRPSWAEEAWTAYRFVHPHLRRPYAPMTVPEAIVGPVAFSPDGQRFASGDTKGVVRVQRFQDGEVVWEQTCVGAEERVWVNGVAFTPDGKYVVTGTESVAQTFDATNGREVSRSFLGNSALAFAMRRITILPDNRTAVCLAGAKGVAAWDVLKPGSMRGLLPYVNVQRDGSLSKRDPPGQDFSVGAFVPLSNGRMLLFGEFPGTNAFEWTIATGATSPSSCPVTNVTAAAVSSDGRMVFLGQKDGTVVAWQPADGGTVWLRGHTDAVNQLAVGDRLMVYSASADGSVRVWDAGAGRLLRRLTGHTGIVHSVAVSPNGMRAVSSGMLNVLRWDVRPTELPLLLPVPGAGPFAIEPDHRLVASVAREAPFDLILHEWPAGPLKKRVHVGARVSDVWISRDGTGVYVQVHPNQTDEKLKSLAGVVYRIEVGEGKSTRFPDAYGDGLVFPRDNVAVKGWKVLRLEDGAELFTMPFGGVAASISRDGRRLVVISGSGGKTISRDPPFVAHCYELPGGRQYARIEGSKPQRRPSLGPNGRFLVTQDAPATDGEFWRNPGLKVWDCERGEIVMQIEDPLGFNAFEFGPDGTLALVVRGTQGHNESLELMDLRTGAVLAALPGVEGRWTPDGASAMVRRGDGLGIWRTQQSRLARFFLTPLRQELPDLPPEDFTNLYEAIGWRVAREGPSEGLLVRYARGARGAR